MEQGLKTLKSKANNYRGRGGDHYRSYSSSGSSRPRHSNEYDRSSGNEDFDDSGLEIGTSSQGQSRQHRHRQSGSIPPPPDRLDNGILRYPQSDGYHYSSSS